ncbi:hypothetical protein ROG8370_02273 [Roseovarius gaetbuli]|uniref:Lipoprotein n=1 Tax=Roseovarius gaetbuli TaxID=1356575 RepID=A0A1X6ZHJ8_9RHOB|nr:hypothetical protein [Roseovarius gaetbuli]SLN51099.1 hypothetical protein ROG8370_02273 [Roseovarius gaetbuli]
MKYPLALLVGLLSACTSTNSVTTRALLLPDPVVFEGRYDSGGGIAVAADIREHEGKTMVCGVWSQSDGQASMTRGAKTEVLGSGSINLEGKALMRGLGGLNEVASAPDYGGAPASCVVTARDWKAGDEGLRPTVHFPRKELYLDAVDVGSDMVRFGPAVPGNGG